MSYKEFIGFRLRKAYLKLHRSAQATLMPYGVTADQFTILTLLIEEDLVTQKDLVDRSESDSSTIAAMVKILEREKLISRKRSLADGRAFEISLTAKGHTVQKELTDALTPLRDSIDEAFSKDEMKILISSLEKIEKTINKKD